MKKSELLDSVSQKKELYVPNPAIVQGLGAITLLLLIGPSASGKDTLIKNLRIPKIRTHTTRDPRASEVDGVDYVFRDDFDQLASEIDAGEFVQIAQGPGDEFYGTKASDYPTEGTAAIAAVPKSIDAFKDLNFKRIVPVYVLPPSAEEWLRRLKARKTSIDDVTARIKEGKSSIEFAMQQSGLRFVITNDPLEAMQDVRDAIADNETTQAAKEVVIRHALHAKALGNTILQKIT